MTIEPRHIVGCFFEELAEAQTPAPVKRKLAAAEKRAMKARDAEKDLKEKDLLSKGYTRWKAEKRKALLEGPHGAEVKGILAFVDTMTLSSAPALLRLVEEKRFVETMSPGDRADLLNLINSGIVRCREKAGLEPFDDEIPWAEPPKAAARLKEMLEVQ